MKHLNGQAKMKNTLYFLLLCASSMASANECRMTIHAKNDTGSTVAAGLFNQRDEKIAVMSIGGKEEVVFKDLCASQYKVIFKDGSKYTESQILNITYTVTVTRRTKRQSWSTATTLSSTRKLALL